MWWCYKWTSKISHLVRGSALRRTAPTYILKLSVEFVEGSKDTVCANSNEQGSILRAIICVVARLPKLGRLYSTVPVGSTERRGDSEIVRSISLALVCLCRAGEVVVLDVEAFANDGRSTVLVVVGLMETRHRVDG